MNAHKRKTKHGVGPIPQAVTPTVTAALLRLDIGCGPHKKEGFHGIDAIAFPGVDTVLDVRKTPWPWADGAVDEAFSSHFFEHLTGAERVAVFNELHRVLKPGGQVNIIVPHWSNDCAYGDPTHVGMPISEWTFLYLNKAWRDGNAPHAGYNTDFDFTYSYNLETGSIAGRSQEWVQFAIRYYRNVIREIQLTLTKRGAS